MQLFWSIKCSRVVLHSLTKSPPARYKSISASVAEVKTIHTATRSEERNSWSRKVAAVRAVWNMTRSRAYSSTSPKVLFTLRAVPSGADTRVFARVRTENAVQILLGPFHGAIAVPSVTRCRRRCRREHRCAGGVRQYSGDTWRIGVRRLVVANGPNIFQMLLAYIIWNICRL